MNNQQQEQSKPVPGTNDIQKQGVDKDPSQEKQHQDQVTDYDLKAKKVDADPEEENAKP